MRTLNITCYLLISIILTNCSNPPSTIPSENSLFKNSVSSIVVVYAFDSNSEILGQGTGFVINSTGTIATNYHVIDDSYFLRVAFMNGEKYDVKEIVAVDEHRDIALIKIHGYDLSTIKLGNSNNISVGDKVIAIGNPLGLSNTLSSGIISGIRTDLEDYKLIQTTTPISPGSSGGPLLNKYGEVIGLTTMYLEGGQNLNFAVPINYLISLLNQGAVPDPIGIQTEDLDLKRELADKYYNNNEYAEAAKLFSEIVDIDNTDPIVFFKLGYSLHRIAVNLGPHNDNDPMWEEYATSAIDNFTKAVELDPENEYGFLKIARVYGLWMIAAIKDKKPNAFKNALKNAQQSGGFFPFVLEANRAVLSSCSKNAILFTNGDDDTFPAWYLQKVENVRDDIIIINLSLLNNPFYIKYLRDFKGVNFNLSDDEIDKLKIKDWPRPRDEIIEISKNKNDFHVGNMHLNIYHSYIKEDWEYLSIPDQLILLIVKNYIDSKDIYFTNVSWLDYSVAFSLYNHTVSEGLVKKLVPQPSQRADSYKKWENNLMENYRYTLFSDPRIFGENISYSFINNYRRSFNELAKIYKYRGNKLKVKEVLSFKDTVIPEENIPIPWDDLVDIYEDGDIGDLYDFAGLNNTEFAYLDSLSQVTIEESWKPTALDTPYYYYKIADFYFDISDFDNSHKYLKEYLKYESSDQEAKNYLMFLDFKLGNNKSALSVANQILTDDPENMKINEIVGDYYFKQGQYDIAANYFDKLLTVNDRDYQTFNTYGLLFLYQNNYDLALDNFKKVIEFAPSYTMSYKYALSNIADTYIAMGKDNEAIDVYMELIEADPTMCLSYSRLAILYHKRGNKVMSDQLLQIAKDNMWEGNYGQLGLACYYSFIGDLENSSYYLQTAIQMGFSDIGWLKYDPYLVNIRETEEFWELIEEK